MEKEQVGFDFDVQKCVQCHACEVACKAAHQVVPGRRWRRVVWFWSGSFPKVALQTVSLSCMHCGDAPCAAACPTGAIWKRTGDGIVLVDQTRCIGCHACLTACPFGVPQYGSDGKMEKCDLCIDRLSEGKEPACVATCPAGALRFGPLSELSERAMLLSARKWVRPDGPV